MKHIVISSLLLIGGSHMTAQTCENYLNNQYPLHRKPLVELPIGSIKPKGWLHEMLVRQKNGATGHMDTLYPLVMGDRNGWLGGDGDQWERGPYWIDGLLPLAYILDDKELKDKVKPWVEWILGSQREDGFFGPAKDYPSEEGIQRDNTHDWWPRMVALKILQQYYSATNDERVISFMTKYFSYQLKVLPEKPLGYYTFWGTYRSAENLQAVYWLYNITREPFLLKLGDLLHQQGADFVKMWQNGDFRRISSIHCVNLAQGIKEPVVYSQRDSNPIYLNAVNGIFKDIRQFHGQAQGLYGGDEALHGNNPTQGSELCSAVELMYSLEKMIEITGNVNFVDHLEKIAFNALPTQISDDFMTKQYFQQANQVKVVRGRKNFDQDHAGTDGTFGLLTGYPCCASNMHQGWPKLVSSLWYSTPDNGLAACVYSPSEVTAMVADKQYVTIAEETNYPMDDNITFVIKDVKKAGIEFSLHLRIPTWCKEAKVFLNGKSLVYNMSENQIVVKNTWKKGDKLELILPMEVKTNTWYENSISLERGPLVFALRMNEKWNKKEFKEKFFGDYYYEVTSDSPWNYGIVAFDKQRVNDFVKIEIDEDKQNSVYPWNLANAPIKIKIPARRIPSWGLYNEMAGPLPYSFCSGAEGPVEEIVLIPYGCTTLRISQFPIVGK